MQQTESERRLRIRLPSSNKATNFNPSGKEHSIELFAEFLHTHSPPDGSSRTVPTDTVHSKSEFTMIFLNRALNQVSQLTRVFANRSDPTKKIMGHTVVGERLTPDMMSLGLDSLDLSPSKSAVPPREKKELATLCIRTVKKIPITVIIDSTYILSIRSQLSKVQSHPLAFSLCSRPSVPRSFGTILCTALVISLKRHLASARLPLFCSTD